MSDLKSDFNDLASKYVRAFTKATGLRLEYWIGDDIGGVALLGDYYFNFNDIRLVVDNAIPSKLLFEWYDAELEWNADVPVYERININLDQYARGIRHADVAKHHNPNA